MKKLIYLIAIASAFALTGHTESQADSSAESSSVESTKAAKADSSAQPALESTKESKSSFCAGKHSNTGCFVGVSLGLSPATSRLDLTTAQATLIRQQPKQESVTIPISLDIGYQWYFAKNSGVRFKAHIGYENFSAKDMIAVASDGSSRKFPLTSHALTYGLEARYLYDFVYGGDHTFGANIGFGVEGSSFFNTITTLIGDPALNQTQDITYPNYTKFAWTGGVGLHYFYKSHHQILLSYTYRGYTDELQKRISLNNVIRARASAFANHTFTLSYAYKF